jgi:hypothetical protein
MNHGNGCLGQGGWQVIERVSQVHATVIGFDEASGVELISILMEGIPAA